MLQGDLPPGSRQFAASATHWASCGGRWGAEQPLCMRLAHSELVEHDLLRIQATGEYYSHPKEPQGTEDLDHSKTAIGCSFTKP